MAAIAEVWSPACRLVARLHGRRTAGVKEFSGWWAPQSLLIDSIGDKVRSRPRGPDRMNDREPTLNGSHLTRRGVDNSGGVKSMLASAFSHLNIVCSVLRTPPTVAILANISGQARRSFDEERASLTSQLRPGRRLHSCRSILGMSCQWFHPGH